MRIRTAPVGSRPVLVYYVVAFAISWGGFLLAGGPGLLTGTDWERDPSFLAAVQLMLAGPPVAGLVLTALVAGRAGLRDLRSRLLRWRVGLRWYAVAVLIAPLVQGTVLLALSLGSSAFLPSIARSDDRASLLLQGVAIGLAGGFVEELGWTGFATPRLLRRRGVLATGVIAGVLWGAWHLLQMTWVGRASNATLSPAVFLSVFFVSSTAALTAYRVLMVWVYDRTESLLVAILMHASYIFSTLFVLGPPLLGVPFLVYSCVFAAALWACAGAAVLGTSRLTIRSGRTAT